MFPILVALIKFTGPTDKRFIPEGAISMSIEGRIRELDHRHSDLKTLIARETLHPSVDDLYLKALKMKKLKLKEELERIKTTYEKDRKPSPALS